MLKRKIILIMSAVSAVLISGMAAMPSIAQTQDPASGIMPIQVYTGCTFELEWSDDASRNLAESVCPQVTLDEETAETYPELKKAFDELNEQKQNDFTENYQQILEDAKNRLEEDPDYTGTFTDTESYYVQRADSNVVSLLGVRTGFSGGAHGYESFFGINYDPVTGKELKLSEFITDESAYKEIVKEGIYKEYPDVDQDLTEAYFEEHSLDDMDWTAGYGGITCYFDEYTLGPYAIGYQTFMVPYEGNGALFTEKAATVSENYGIEFPLNHTFSVGGREILVYGDLSEYGSYDSITILLDGEKTVFDDDIYTYSIRPTYLRANGEEYLYLEFSSDNDYKMLDLYRLGEKPEHIGTINLFRTGIYAEETYSAIAAINDPDHMLLSARTVLLGTANIQNVFRVGEDGKPEAIEPYFLFAVDRIPGKIMQGNVLTTKQEISCEEVDEAGDVIGTISIPAGEKVTKLRTDNKTMEDLKLADGRIARVTFSEGASYVIDGKNIEELFDGMLFAG